jgi:D-altritol 5-dehydrogenase
MQAIQFRGKGEAVRADLPVPPLAPGHALVRVRAAGLCHTDIEVLHGRYGENAFPLVPGHEYAGVVEAVASDVAGIRVGARVAVDPNIACGRCRSCRRGLSNLCAELKAYGVTHDGGFAAFSAVAVDHLHDIGDMPFERAALAEPLACVLNGLGVAGIEASARLPENALVIGAGPIGMLLALAVKARGVSDVAVADIDEDRLRFAEELGLRALDSRSGAMEAQHTRFDFVADATGVSSVAAAAPGYAADGGTVLFFGVCAPGTTIPVSPFEIFRRQLRLCGSHSLNRNIADALAMLQADGETMARLVSHRLPMEEMLPFFTAKTAAKGTMKVQFQAD